MVDPYNLAGKAILVTGASSGIGRATTVACSQMGATVFLTGRNEDELQKTLAEMEGEGHQYLCADLATMEGVDALAAWSPVLDGFVNNAGICETLPVSFVTQEKLVKTMAINTYAPALLLTGLLRKNKIKKGASVVFTSSISGNRIFWGGNCAYSASKAAVDAYARNAALELAPRNIRVNTVCPGMIETNLMKEGKLSEELLAEDRKRYPIKRYGKPEEVAYAIVYLLSDAASFVTGSQLVIDGGYTLQ